MQGGKFSVVCQSFSAPAHKVSNPHTAVTHLFEICHLFSHLNSNARSRHTHMLVPPYNCTELNVILHQFPMMTKRHGIANHQCISRHFQYYSDSSSYCKLEMCCLSCQDSSYDIPWLVCHVQDNIYQGTASRSHQTIAQRFDKLANQELHFASYWWQSGRNTKILSP